MGRNIVVTGATSGIGRACAILFASEGARVVANHLGQAAEAASLQASCAALEGEIVPFEADVSRAEQVRGLMEEATSGGRAIDVLVANAGISLVRPLEETSDDDFDRVIGTDLRAVFLCAREALPGLRASDAAAIVNVASELALSGRAKFSAYCAAKAGVIGLTKALALELAPAIRVNAVAPGPTRTPMLEAELALPDHDEPVSAIPMGRYAEPEEVAETIAFLASPSARYYCGETLSPNGGTVMR